MRPSPASQLAALVFALASSGLAAHPETAEAQALLDRLIVEFPKDAELYFRRAALRVEHSEWPAAEADLRRAQQLEPGSARVARQLGQLCLARGQLAAAEKYFEAALAVAPGDAGALIDRARLRAQLGNPDGAHADYSLALHLLAAPSPDLFLARAALPVTPALAVRGLDEGLARLGPAAPLLERALALELRLGRTDAALARLDTLAARSEQPAAMLKRRGDILAAAGRTPEAREAYARARAALAALPAWLRESSAPAQLDAELRRLTSTSS